MEMIESSNATKGWYYYKEVKGIIVSSYLSMLSRTERKSVYGDRERKLILADVKHKLTEMYAHGLIDLKLKFIKRCSEIQFTCKICGKNKMAMGLERYHVKVNAITSNFHGGSMEFIETNTKDHIIGYSITSKNWEINTLQAYLNNKDEIDRIFGEGEYEVITNNNYLNDKPGDFIVVPYMCSRYKERLDEMRVDDKCESQMISVADYNVNYWAALIAHQFVDSGKYV
jgi:hypothetical protein